MHIKSEFIRKINKEYSIREMTYDDVDKVYEIDTKADVTPWSKTSFYDCIDRGYYCFVLLYKSEIAAFGVMSTGAGEAHVLNVAVDPKFHRKGMGMAMMEVLLQIARGEAQIIYLEVRVSNKAAISLYRKLKFIEINQRKGYYLNNDNTTEDALIMMLPFLNINKS